MLNEGTIDETAVAGEQDGGARGDLQRLVDEGFGGEISAAALALGREEDQIIDMISGDAEIDEDLEMKIRAMVQERVDSEQ